MRIIRNEFEKYHQNPLAFHLKCLKTETDADKKELFDLIKREIEARDWFVYCESSAAEHSDYVKLEREYVKECNKKFIWTIDMDADIETIKRQVRDICVCLQVRIFSHKQDKAIANALAKELRKDDFDVHDDSMIRADSIWPDFIRNDIAEISQKGFFVFVCTINSLSSSFVDVELKEAKRNGAKIITLQFEDAEIPDHILSVLDKNNIYRIPNIPKEGDWYLLVNLIKAALKRKIDGAIDIKADALNSESILQEKLNYDHRYHSMEPFLLNRLGPTDDYIEIYEFPCCHKKVAVGNGPISRFRCDGCCADE